MTQQRITINVIQDVATPHNNTLLKALNENQSINLQLWYAYLTHPQYSFGPELAHEVREPIIFGFKHISFRLFFYVLMNKNEKFFIVGWVNPTIRILLPILCILRRPFNMWFDLPKTCKKNKVKFLFRHIYYLLLKISNAKIFCVGKKTENFFKDFGLNKDRITNLPIFISIDKPTDYYKTSKQKIRSTFGVMEHDLFISTGSRLLYEKGFDLLISAISLLPILIRNQVKLLIVGKGQESDTLKNLVSTYSLQQQIFFREWMDEHEFRCHVAASDVLVHPARFDAFGGSTLIAMAVGVPVIGTKEAGSAYDRIEHAVNGWLYNAEDINELATILSYAYNNRSSLEEMGRHARLCAEKWKSSCGAKIVIDNTI